MGKIVHGRLSLALGACALVGPLRGAPEQGDRTVVLTFGVYTSEKPTVMYKSFTPIVKHLTDDLQKRLGRPVNIQFTIQKSYDETIDALVAGKVDFVRVGPSSYVLAKERNPRIQLLAMELEEDGNKLVKGVIIVAKGSPVQKLSELRGKTFAFGDENSTIGRYLAQSELLKAGIKASDLKSYQYLLRHDKVAKAVELGDFDAGAVHAKTFEAANKTGTLRALATFDNLTKPWVVREGIRADVADALRSALVGLHEAEILKELKSSGFAPAVDDEFEFVRKGMKMSKDFEDAPPKLAPKPEKAAGVSKAGG